MPTGLKRVNGRGDLHFITFCCYHRRPLLRTTLARNVVVEILGKVRADLGFALVGYVLMPDHLHLLVGEKLYYMHANPVREKLVSHPGEWPWSSWSFYYWGRGLLAMDRWQ